jgi:hypothetical protein
LAPVEFDYLSGPRLSHRTPMCLFELGGEAFLDTLEKVPVLPEGRQDVGVAEALLDGQRAGPHARGELDIVRENDAGSEMTLATLRPGQFFGEIGLLTDSPRTASVRARGPAELLALDRQHFETLVAQSNATADELAAMARRRLSDGPAPVHAETNEVPCGTTVLGLAGTR